MKYRRDSNVNAREKKETTIGIKKAKEIEKERREMKRSKRSKKGRPR